MDLFEGLHERWVGSRASDQVKLREEVGSWKRGMWTPKELSLLRRNVDKFMKDHDISDLEGFIYGSKRGGRSHFYRSIARDIRRPIFSVYRKVVALYDVGNYVGKWTAKQEKKLLRLYDIHGSNWVAIGRCLGRSGRAVQDKHRDITKREKKGTWSQDEEDRLVSAFKTVTDDDHLSLYDTELPPTVTWNDIADLVGTRNAKQCFTKWVFILSWKEKGGVKTWNVRDDVKLLHCLSSLSVDDEDEVEWAGLCQDWEAARSSCYLRTKWGVLRRTVPRYKLQSFQDNLDYLLEYRLPALEKRLRPTGADSQQNS